MNRKFAVILVVAVIGGILGVLYAKPQSAPQVQQDQCCGGNQFGAIEGFIQDPNGRPVADATVYAERTDAIMLAQMSAKTGKDGRFLLKEMLPGTYRLTGSKEKDGYARTNSTFHYRDSVFPTLVVVYAQQISPNAKVQLREKLAKLFIHVSDFDTGKAVRDAEMTLHHLDNPAYLYSASLAEGENVLLVPASPLELRVSRQGYLNWKYRNSTAIQPTDALLLARGETKKLAVALKRNK